MHAVAAFFASIITFVSGFFVPAVASNSPVDVRAAQPAAAAAAQTEIIGDPFNDPAAALAVAAASPATPTPSVPPSPSQTIINQPVIERIIERIVPQGAGSVSTETLAAILADFEQSISSRIAAITPSKAVISEQVAAGGNSASYYFVPASQRIDQLTNTAINTPTITGGTISNATVSGTLSGAFSGTASFTTATTSSLAISSIPWGLLSTDGSGDVVATSTPAAAAFIATSTIASQFPYASSTALTVSGTGFFGTATSTNLFAQTASLGILNLPGITNAILSTNSSGQVVATTSIGTNLLTGILPIANGGTATGTQVTNGVNYFDGTHITSGNALTFDGTTVTAPRGAFSSTSGTTTIASGQGFTVGASQFVLQQSSGNIGIGTASPAYALDVNGDVNVASGKCFRVAGTCIGYVVKLAAIYATSTPGANVSVVFTGTQGSAPSFSAGTLTLPSNTSYIVTEVWGGGGGGGGTATGYAGGGGGAGYSQKVYTNLATTYFYNIGAGGAGGAAADDGTGNGSSGVASSFGTGLATSTANGGGGGSRGGNSVWGLGGAGGTASGGDVNLTGGGGGNAYYTSVSMAGSGGSAPRGGGGGRTYPGGAVNGEAGAAFGGGGGGGIIGSGGAGGSGGLVITVYATSSPNATGNDYAENFPVSDPGITAGDIVSVDNGVPVSMRYARKGDKTLAGIISTQPGQLLGDKDAIGMRPVALAGRVPTKVNMENGPIALGDRIAVSSTPGVGMKAGPFDDAVGIALEAADQDGTIMTFVTLSRGVDINAIAMTLLGNDTALFAVSTTATSTAIASTTTGPLDFVGGMMNAIALRIILADGTSTATNFSLTDSYTDSFLNSIFGRLIAWFADATNGIHDFYAGIIHSQEDHTQKLCIGSTCVTESQLQAMLAAAGQAVVSSSTSTPEGTSQSPVIELNGNASSTIEVGDTYNDLGARIVAPETDLNLGIVILLDGSTTTTISLDTSTPGEHIILYTVTSPTTGLTASITRTVIVSPAEQSPEQPANDNPFNPAPANDNASATTAVDAAA